MVMDGKHWLCIIIDGYVWLFIVIIECYPCLWISYH